MASVGNHADMEATMRKLVVLSTLAVLTFITAEILSTATAFAASIAR